MSRECPRCRGTDRGDYFYMPVQRFTLLSPSKVLAKLSDGTLAVLEAPARLSHDSAWEKALGRIAGILNGWKGSA